MLGVNDGILSTAHPHSELGIWAMATVHPGLGGPDRAAANWATAPINFISLESADVYHVPSEQGALYVKFTADAVTEFLLLPFKEKGND